MTDGAPADTVVTDDAVVDIPRGRADLGAAVAIAAVCAALGVALGFAWLLVAPRPQVVGGPDGAFFSSDLPGEFIAADGWFAALSVVAGVVLAAFVLVRRDVGPLAVVASAVCGVLGSLLAWRIGVQLGGHGTAGPDLAAGASGYGDLTLRAKGVLLVWPIVTLGVLLFALAWQSPQRDRPKAAAVDASVPGDRQVGQVDGGQ